MADLKLTPKERAFIRTLRRLDERDQIELFNLAAYWARVTPSHASLPEDEADWERTALESEAVSG